MNKETHEKPTDDNRSLTHRLFITTRQPYQLINMIDVATSTDPVLSTMTRMDLRISPYDKIPTVCIDGPELHGSIIISFIMVSEYYYVNMECYQADSTPLDRLVSNLDSTLVHLPTPENFHKSRNPGCVHGLLRTITETGKSCMDFTGSAYESARRCRFQDLKNVSEGIQSYFTPETLKKGKFERVADLNGDWERNRVVLHNGSKVELRYQYSVYCKKEMESFRLVFNVDAVSGRFIVGHVDTWTPVPF